MSVFYSNLYNLTTSDVIERNPLIRAAVSFQGVNGTIIDQINVASVTRNVLGVYDIVYDLPFPDVLYFVSIQTASGAQSASYEQKTPEGIRVRTFVLSAGVFIPADPTEVSVLIFHRGV